MWNIKKFNAWYLNYGDGDLEMAYKCNYVWTTYFSFNPTLCLCDYVYKTLFGDVFISLNWGSLYLWDMSQITLPSSQWQALLPEFCIFPGWVPPLPAVTRQEERDETHISWYPFLSRAWPKRALKLLDKMKFLDYQWISITVSVLSRPLLLSIAWSWQYCWDLWGFFTG